jgi:uncharacterized RDD family membrane protein YckC
MSTMPDGNAADQEGGSPQGTHPGAPQQPSAPTQEQHAGMPHGPVPAQHVPEPSGAARDQGDQEDQAYQRERPAAVTRDVHVTGRRVVQYLIDAFLVSIIPSLISIPFDRSNSTFIHILGGIVAFGVFVLIGFLYWVMVPHRMNGQTPGMKLLGLRVVSKHGGPASMAQLTIRWICLIFDAIPYTWPFTGLVGFIVILCSRDRQRIGDHLARTLVIAASREGRHAAG